MVAWLRRLGHQVQHVPPTHRIEGRRRLVQEQHVGSPHECLRDSEALAHAARVGARRAVGRIGDPDTIEDLGDPPVQRFLDVRVEPADVGEDLPAGHPAVEARFLPEVADLRLVRLTRGQRDARHRRAARGRAAEAGEDLDGGGLAGAVRPEEPVDRALRHVDREVIEGHDAREVFREVRRRDCAGHRSPPLAPPRMAVVAGSVGNATTAAIRGITDGATERTARPRPPPRPGPGSRPTARPGRASRGRAC